MERFRRSFSFQGRTNRGRFWLTAIAIYGILIASAFVSVGLSSLSPFFAILFLPIVLAALVASLANAVRRLHDRAKSGWWLFLFAGVPGVFLLPLQIMRNSADPGAAGFAALCALISLPFSIWALVEMGCLRGSVGANRFGDDPLRPPASEVFA